MVGFTHGDLDAATIMNRLDKGEVPAEGWEPTLREVLHAYLRLYQNHCHLMDGLAASIERYCRDGKQ